MRARQRGHGVSDRLTKGSGSQDRTGELYCSRAASLVEGLTGPFSAAFLLCVTRTRVLDLGFIGPFLVRKQIPSSFLSMVIWQGK